jgi:hypothetical protein
MKNLLKRRKDQERDKLNYQEQLNALDLEVKGAQQELSRKKEVAKSADFASGAAGLFKNNKKQKLIPSPVPLPSLEIDQEQLDVNISNLDVKRKPFMRKKKPVVVPI